MSSSSIFQGVARFSSERCVGRRRRDDVLELARSDPRTPDEEAEYEHLRSAVLKSLKRLGRRDAAKRFDRNHLAAYVPGLDPVAVLAVRRMTAIGVPAAVFLIEPRPKGRATEPVRGHAGPP